MVMDLTTVKISKGLREELKILVALNLTKLSGFCISSNTGKTTRKPAIILIRKAFLLSSKYL